MPEFAELAPLRIMDPSGVRAAAIALRELATALFDCRVCVCHNIAVKQCTRDGDGNLLATSVFGWTDDEGDRWWRTPRLALDSPLPTACRYESEPFWCNADGFRTHHHNPLISSIDLTNFEQRCLARAAIVVPVHMPFGHVGAASFIPVDSDHVDLSKEFEAFGDKLGLYTRTFINSYHRIMVKPERLPVGPVLSKREVECLRWAAIGKTDQEISMILTRSRATVRFHMHNAGMKLDAVNRSQTVFKATQLGYIGLNS
jgi:LuxR family quorum-sensing system transcriptional regulator CciR